MTPLHPFFAVLLFVIAFLTAHLIRLNYRLEMPTGRYECIDGLRGFLALGVFIHHASVWHQYLQTGQWEAPKSNLYNQLGLASVSFFFMITSFLFVNKLLHSDQKEFNWRDFFVSRMFRLIPMYYFSLLLLVFLIMMASRWQLNSSIIDYAFSIFHWGLFTVYKSPLINNYDFTHHVNAGVVWSLPYEWMFYFTLPLIAVLLKVRTSVKFVFAGFIFLISFYIYHGIIFYHILSFMGGAIAPFLIKYRVFSRNNVIKKTITSVLIIIALLFIVQFRSVYNVWCILLIALVFTIIALGNTVFGILRSPTLRLLGEVCYSTYLLHGIVLFTVFNGWIGYDRVKHLQPAEYCILICMITPLVVLFSFLGFKYIEKPGIDKAKYLLGKWATTKSSAAASINMS